jgi:hypothetical protein
MRKNWLLVDWACAEICYSLAEHARESFRHITCVSEFFLSSHVTHASAHLLWSPSNVLCPPLSRLCTLSPILSPLLFCLCSLSPILGPLSHISVPCLPSAVPVLRLCSLYPVLYPLSCGSAPCLLSSVPCLTWPVPFLPFSFLRPLSAVPVSPICGSISLFLSFAPLVPVLCSSDSCPLSLQLLSLVFHTCENASFSSKYSIPAWTGGGTLSKIG